MPGKKADDQIDRQTAVAAWATHMISNDAVFLDTETTGVRQGAEIVDVAVVGSDGRIIFDSLVRPNGLIPEAATNIHGINDLDVIDAPKWVEVYGQVIAAIDGRPVVIYNKDFDLRIIQWSNNANKLPLIDDRDWHCAMLQYARFVGEAPTNMRNKRTGFKWHKLEDAVLQMGLNLPAQSHRAAGDAIYTRHLVRELANQYQRVALPI